MDGKKTLLIARFPYGNQEVPSVGDWLVKTVSEAKAHPRIGSVKNIKLDDTPITMTRNMACRQAQLIGADYLLMVDSDMYPDLDCTGDKTFFLSSLEFMLRHEGPCVVAAPYCGPPPECLVYMFKWTSGINLHEQPDASWKLEMLGREEAAMWRGITEVAAAPTGLILIDVKALDEVDPPWFDYEYTDRYECEKSTTEDVYFTRNLSLNGVPVYSNWDCWGGHWKRWLSRRPLPIFVDQIRGDLARRVQHGYRSNQILEQVLAKDGEIIRGIDANPRIRPEKAEESPNGDGQVVSGVAGQRDG